MSAGVGRPVSALARDAARGRFTGLRGDLPTIGEGGIDALLEARERLMTSGDGGMESLLLAWELALLRVSGVTGTLLPLR